MNMDELGRDLNVLLITFDAADTPEELKQYKPVVFQDEDGFCCLLGESPDAGVFGCGATPEDAIADWRMSLQHKKENDIPFSKDTPEIFRKKLEEKKRANEKRGGER